MLTNPLLDEWRAKAADRRAEGIEIAAKIYELVANQLEVYERERELESLGLERASQESGYSTSHLQRLVAENRLPNAGQPHKPRIQRRHLPRKPGAFGPDLLGIAKGELP
jgi:hypothetical protein